jgi:acyl-CoA reductase-like NAD-dependent aldehyde dehydrogenase
MAKQRPFGQFVHAKSGATFAATNPATGATLTVVASCAVAGVDKYTELKATWIRI